MVSSRSKAILLSVAAFFVLRPAFVTPADSLVPARAKLLFQDDFSTSSWQGAKVETGVKYQISGKVLVPAVYGDTARIESEVDFSLEPESFLSFDLRCSGYQRLRIYAFEEGENAPKSFLLTHFKAGELQKVNLPVDGNFHNFHWRRGDYSALKAGDSINRLVFEFTLREDSPLSIQIGGLTVYRLTEEVHRERFEKSLAAAKKAVAEIPASLEAVKHRLGARLEEVEQIFRNPPRRYIRSSKELKRRVTAVFDAAERINRYYQPACEALNRPEVDYCVGGETGLRRVTHANQRLRFKGRVPAEPRISLAVNEKEAFQLVVMPFDRFLRKVQVFCSDLEGPDGRIEANWITVGRLELVRTQLSPHSNGTDLGWVPDPIIPLGTGHAFDVQPEAELALWFEVYTPFGTPAGVYSGTVTIQPENSHPTKVPLVVTVWDYQLPLQGVFRTQGHFSIERIEDFYNR